ncbi:primosomal replication protein N [Ramlibacter sp.]|uniref:primosomal replication protein N n=1 Tax=Ramlibacter sp. TaxID=1917967 RepID=UPI002D0CBA3F|nr:primosomal replication protein N [Ramlibacter sp.]HWI80641.1 primosomal replication protein N [Ramlibacter sp.]
MNQVVLSAWIVEASALRYTPAGLPALDLRLEHESEASEAGRQRTVKAAIRAVALGSVAETLGQQAIGSGWTFTGFLATPRNGKHPVLHIQSFQQS